MKKTFSGVGEKDIENKFRVSCVGQMHSTLSMDYKAPVITTGRGRKLPSILGLPNMRKWGWAIHCGKDEMLLPIPHDIYLGLPLNVKDEHYVMNIANGDDHHPLKRYKIVELPAEQVLVAESKGDISGKSENQITSESGTDDGSNNTEIFFDW